MKNLSKTEKENIVKRCLSGEGITVLANEYGISRGSIYSELKIVQSFSKAGVPYDNSVCESFFKNM
jgi:transposase-like protein